MRNCFLKNITTKFNRDIKLHALSKSLYSNELNKKRLLYKVDHHIKWVMLGYELDRMKELNFKECQHGPFTHVGSVPFYLIMDPKGHNHEGVSETFLYCDASQHNISKMEIQYTLYIHQINFSASCQIIYPNFPCGWSLGPKWDELKDLYYFDVDASFKILNIFDNNDNMMTKIERNKYLNALKPIKTVSWSLNNNEINQLKKGNNMSSRTINFGKIPFIVLVRMNDLHNCVSFYAECHAQGLDISKLAVWYHVKCDQLGFRQVGTCMYNFFPSSCVSNPVFYIYESLAKDNYDICVTLQILNVYDNDGNVVNENDLMNKYGFDDNEFKYDEDNPPSTLILYDYVE